ncbi:growth arrest and DNA damage-inducible proteins-interacting protein 1-like [Centruroides sculpturatus]|uniref:growth arrest and DNA damage-inducible proteins-interacting protein 1-like n=1 Tax=Centruroides sculpturatus TaxID=218467 RepID=UPI000C6DCC6E|nr:growth arrest and DNA damage-inducible proteins-interacting protein 1-like [Centruroides sculpturatus]XP_023217626.1 growth arrest and DNA damage-inducible proteins-interacting protein 1-like [Centruroides sculpturatus]
MDINLKLLRNMYRFFTSNTKNTLFLDLNSLKRYNFKLCSTIVSEEASDNNEIDEIEKKRDISRLPESVRQIYMKKQMLPLQYFHHYKLANLRKNYARFGKKCGINPGLMWPSKEYLKELKKYQSIAYTPLNEMLAKVREKDQQDVEYRREREEMIEKNMAKVDTWMREFEIRKQKKEAEAKAQKLRKQKLIEDVQEYIGYKMDPKDERFQEVLQMKEEEEKKVKRKLKKQEREQKMLAMLLGTAEEQSPKNS